MASGNGQRTVADNERLPDLEEGLLDPETPWYHTPFFERLILLIFPPLGLALVWRNRNHRRRQRLIATALALVYAVPYGALCIFLLVQTGTVAVEWRGGLGPSLVRRSTQPNYKALEESRAEQRVTPLDTQPTGSPPPPYWTAFRGPRRDGVYDEGPIATNWVRTPPRCLWRQPVGGGYASLVVADNRAFTIEQRRDDEAVTAYDLETGRELWRHSYPALFQEWMGGDGPRATPAYHEGLIYSLGASGVFCCLGAANGQVLWQKNILAENSATNLTYGLTASPLVVDDKVILLGGETSEGRTVLAYHRLSGERLWSALDDRAAYASPLLTRLADQRQVLVVTAARAVGLAPEDGRLLWEFPWRVSNGNNTCAPVIVGTNRLFLSAGYGAGCALVEVSRTNEGFRAREIWRNRNLRNKFNPSVHARGAIYGLDEGVLACLDAATGERRWRDGNYGYGQLLLAGGHLIVLGGDGELALVEANPERRIEIARLPALTGKTWNVPALAHGRLLVRNNMEMACYDLRPPESRRRADSP